MKHGLPYRQSNPTFLLEVKLVELVTFPFSCSRNTVMRRHPIHILPIPSWPVDSHLAPTFLTNSTIIPVVPSVSSAPFSLEICHASSTPTLPDVCVLGQLASLNFLAGAKGVKNARLKITLMQDYHQPNNRTREDSRPLIPADKRRRQNIKL